MSNPFSPLILPTEDNRGLQSSLLTVIDALNVVTPRLGAVEDILAAAGLTTTRFGAIPMTWLGPYTAAFVYLHGDVVTHNLLLMIANKTTAQTPALAASDWDLLIDGTATGGDVAGNLAVTEAADTFAATGVAATFHGVRVYQNTPTTSITSSLKTLGFDRESYDLFGLHSNTVNNSRLTVDIDGIWDIIGQFRAVNAVRNTAALLHVRLDGVTNIAQSQETYGEMVSLTIDFGAESFVVTDKLNTKQVTQVGTGPIFLQAGQFVELRTAIIPTNSSDTGEFTTWFAMYRVGP